MRSVRWGIVLFLGVGLVVTLGRAADWTRFRGPNGDGHSADTNLPEKWSDSENLKWKTEMPGAGSSSPIVIGKHVFVTCYSGYGLPKSNGGETKSLQRQLVCLNRADGTVLWTKTVANESPEDDYQGFISEHGYASNTPVTDGERVYCFFGKSGVLAFDFEGKKMWQTDVGKSSSNRRWGSGASLLLHNDLVIVNASEESKSIRGLDKKTGKEVWSAPGAALELAYGTPALATSKENRTDLVISVPGEIWGLNPDTGKLRWHAAHLLTGNICPSMIVDGETAYVFGGFRSSGSFTIRAGGSGDVVKSHIGWSSRNSSYVATPVLHEKHLYWVDDHGQAFCISAETGEQVYQERVKEVEAGGRPVYASPVVANGKIFVQTRWSGVLILPASPEFKVLVQNKFSGDDSDFNATPAISDNELFLRSNKFLYCVGKEGSK